MVEDGREREIETGQKGGAAEVHMGEAAYPVAESVSVTLGHVRWSALLAGTVIALALTVLMNILGVALGLSLTRFGFGGGLGYWMVAFAAASLPSTLRLSALANARVVAACKAQSAARKRNNCSPLGILL
jgi:hypothetical protein